MIEKKPDLRRPPRGVEWPTLALLLICYTAWIFLPGLLAALSLWLAVPVLAVILAFHSSLQHEALHGHPTQNALINGALVFPALGLFIPYLRFKDTHLDHHFDERLTDPYDDPETNFLDPDTFAAMRDQRKFLCNLNNTLLGRMLIGPVFAQLYFMATDLKMIRAGNRRVMLGWGLHVLGILPVAAFVIWQGAVPVWAYVLAAYLGLSLLKIRTFLEHRAHELAQARTVIIEDRGPLAALFLNNNLHAVHHSHPRVPWYRLWRLYQSDKSRFLDRNDGYVYRSYAEIFRAYFFHRKDPVPHPLWPK